MKASRFFGIRRRRRTKKEKEELSQWGSVGAQARVYDVMDRTFRGGAIKALNSSFKQGVDVVVNPMTSSIANAIIPPPRKRALSEYPIRRMVNPNMYRYQTLEEEQDALYEKIRQDRIARRKKALTALKIGIPIAIAATAGIGIHQYHKNPDFKRWADGVRDFHTKPEVRSKVYQQNAQELENAAKVEEDRRFELLRNQHLLVKKEVHDANISAVSAERKKAEEASKFKTIFKPVGKSKPNPNKVDPDEQYLNKKFNRIDRRLKRLKRITQKIKEKREEAHNTEADEGVLLVYRFASPAEAMQYSSEQKRAARKKKIMTAVKWGAGLAATAAIGHHLMKNKGENFNKIKDFWTNKENRKDPALAIARSAPKKVEKSDDQIISERGYYKHADLANNAKTVDQIEALNRTRKEAGLPPKIIASSGATIEHPIEVPGTKINKHGKHTEGSKSFSTRRALKQRGVVETKPVGRFRFKKVRLKRSSEEQKALAENKRAAAKLNKPSVATQNSEKHNAILNIQKSVMPGMLIKVNNPDPSLFHKALKNAGPKLVDKYSHGAYVPHVEVKKGHTPEPIPETKRTVRVGGEDRVLVTKGFQPKPIPAKRIIVYKYDPNAKSTSNKQPKSADQQQDLLKDTHKKWANEGEFIRSVSVRPPHQDATSDTAAPTGGGGRHETMRKALDNMNADYEVSHDGYISHNPSSSYRAKFIPGISDRIDLIRGEVSATSPQYSSYVGGVGDDGMPIPSRKPDSRSQGKKHAQPVPVPLGVQPTMVKYKGKLYSGAMAQALWSADPSSVKIIYQDPITRLIRLGEMLCIY